MNDCDESILFNSNYNWGFRHAENKSSYAIAMVAQNELYGQIIDNLELIINELEL
jgi:hypothetical protein